MSWDLEILDLPMVFMFRRIIPNGATGIELAEHLGITKQAVSKMVDYLEKSGYVMPQTHPTDKRGEIIIKGKTCLVNLLRDT